MKFFDRKYLLQIGDGESGDGLSINDLQINFRVRKSSNNKEKIDRATIKVYNLSEESINVLEEDYNTVVLSCGYESEDNLVRLFYGEITDSHTEVRGIDRITTIDISPSFSELTFKIMSELIPEGGTVEDVIEVIRSQTSLAKGVYKGASLTRKIVYGYPLCGTPKEMLDRLTSTYKLEWRTDGDSLFINDYQSVETEVTETAPVISPTTGLIDKPYPFKGSGKKSKEDKENLSGVSFTALLNPNVNPGTIVKVEYQDTSNFYRVEEVEFLGDFRGRDWYMKCICSRRPE